MNDRIYAQRTKGREDARIADEELNAKEMRNVEGDRSRDSDSRLMHTSYTTAEEAAFLQQAAARAIALVDPTGMEMDDQRRIQLYKHLEP